MTKSPVELRNESAEAQAVRQALRDLVARHGSAVLGDARRVRSMLADACPTGTAEIHVIFLALSQGTPAHLGAAATEQASLDRAISRSAEELQRVEAVDLQAARWAVTSCAWAEGLLDGPVGDDHPSAPEEEPMTKPKATPSTFNPPLSQSFRGSDPPPGPGTGGHQRGSLSVRAESMEFTFPPGTRVTIGRDPASSVALSSPAVSRQHAVIEFSDDTWLLTDSTSTQGTFAHGSRVNLLAINTPVDVALGQGAEAVNVHLAEIGRVQPSAHPVDQSASTPADPADRMRPGGVLTPGGAAPTELREPAPLQQLVVEAGGQRRILAVGASLTIGREPDNDLMLSEASVSRHHARIKPADRGWVMEDLSSSGGTWLGSARVATMPLAGKQAFRLGDKDGGGRVVTTAPGINSDPTRSFARLQALVTTHRTTAMITAAVVVAIVVAVLAGTVFTSSPSIDRDALARATVRIEAGDYVGSGEIIDKAEGLILTNAHVVAPQADGQAVASQSFPDELHPDPGPKVQIDVSPGLDQASEPMFLGSVVAVDGYLDIAVVKITGTLSGAIVDQSQLNDLTQVTLGDSGNAQSGDPVLAVGYPVAAQSPIATFTTGVVSGFIPDARIGTNLAKLNTSAEISGGNSGGVLADSAGQLIGVTTWGLPDDNGQIALSSARPIDLAKAVISAAENGKHYVSPYVTPAPAGATVERVDQVGAGDNGTVTSGCSAAGNGSGSFALGMQYKGFPAGKQTDVMAALYATNSDGSETQVAVANDFDDSDYPTTLPTSGCATLTFDWLAQPTAGTYTLQIGVGGDLKVIYKEQITVS